MHRLLLVALGMLAFTGCSVASGNEEASKQESGARPSPREAVAQAAVVVDVRTPGEFAGGHLERAVNIPIDELDGRLGEIDRALEGDRTKKLVVYCASGRRSGIAKDLLEKKGYGAVTNAGGYASLR
jgi:phage shock protein E